MCIEEKESIDHPLSIVNGFVHFSFLLFHWWPLVGFICLMLKMFGNLENEIEKELGSWDLDIGSFSCLVVNLKRENSMDFWRQRFFPLIFQYLFLGNVE